MHASSHRLAYLLAQALSKAMPPGYSVEAVGGELAVYRHDDRIGAIGATRIVDDVDERSAIARAATAVRSALNSLQDIVSEDARVPWPTAPAGCFARADAEARGDEIHLGFTSDSGDALRLPAFRWP